MATRQEADRLLAGRNSANPLEMRAAFDLSPDAALGVGGVNQATAPQPPRMDAEQEVLNGLASFGSKTIRDAAKARVERLVVDGQIAYQQGKAIEELPTDNNKWMLEGYRAMEADTAVSAVLAAQQEEIANGLYASDPDQFRSIYNQRVAEALDGKDAFVQDAMKAQFAKALPQLVEGHTRAHVGYLAEENTKAVRTAVDIMSRDTTTVDGLLDIAAGKGAASGLAPDKQRSALIEGVVQAYANDNPMAYAILQEKGFFDSLTAQEAAALDSAKNGYETRVMSNYDPARIERENKLLHEIEQGHLEPDAAMAEYADYLAEYHVEPTAQQAQSIYSGAEQAGAQQNQATQYEIKTAKLNGDYARVAELSAPYANNAGQRGAMPSYEHQTQIEFQMGPKRPNRPNQPVLDVLGKSAEDVFGPGAKIVVTSGQEGPDKPQHGSNRHKTGNAADVQIIKPDGTVVGVDSPEMKAFAKAAATNGAQGIGFGAEYMGDHIHVDLVQPGEGQGRVWASGAKGIAGELTGAMAARTGAPSVGKIDQQKWVTAVDYAKGDIELAAVVYADGQDAAEAWVSGGRKPDTLSAKASSFQTGVMQGVNGFKYETAAVRADRAKVMYEQARDRASLPAYADILAKDTVLDQQYLAGEISQQQYSEGRAGNRAEWGLAATKEDIKYEIGQYKERQSVISAEKTETYKIDVQAAEMQLQTRLDKASKGAIPEGMDPGVFNASQATEVIAARREFLTTVADSAQRNGVSLKDRGVVGINDRMTQQVRSALEKARENTKQGVELRRYQQTGTLGSAPEAIRARALKEQQSYVAAMAQKEVQSRGLSGADAKEAAITMSQGLMEDWYASNNYVPEETRNQMSTALQGELVGRDGVVSPMAIEAVKAYRDLRVKSTTAAGQLLDKSSALFAQVVLDQSGGDDAAIQRTIASMWIEGVGNKFRGQPAPKWYDQPDVQAEVDSRIGWGENFRGLKRWVFGDSELGTANLTDESNEALRSVLSAKVADMQTVQPGINPKLLVKAAERAAARSMAPIRAEPGSQSDANSFIIAEDGADIWAQTFGADSDTYAADRSNFANALDGYLSSDVFQQRYGTVRPEQDNPILHGILAATPFFGGMFAETRNNLVPQYTVQMIKGGNAAIDFVLDDEGTTQTIFVPLSEMGEWYKGTDEAHKTRRR